jgi:hypothetical protein
MDSEKIGALSMSRAEIVAALNAARAASISKKARSIRTSRAFPNSVSSIPCDRRSKS